MNAVIFETTTNFLIHQSFRHLVLNFFRNKYEINLNIKRIIDVEANKSTFYDEIVFETKEQQDYFNFLIILLCTRKILGNNIKQDQHQFRVISVYYLKLN